MRILSSIRKWGEKLGRLAGQLYTPKELRALLLFAALGIAVLIFRSGAGLYQRYFPQARSAQSIPIAGNQDSLFHALSAIADVHDSLFFSLPEDSLLPNSRKQVHHVKGEGMQLHSISLNKARKEDLILLPGIGPAKAEQILEYRSERGRFRTLSEIENVRGIGKKRYDGIKKYLRLN